MTPADELRALPPGPLRDLFLDVVESAADPFDRALRPAHVTASAVVLDDAAQRELLVRHR